jgi:hypothetical protein
MLRLPTIEVYLREQNPKSDPKISLQKVHKVRASGFVLTNKLLWFSA